MSCAHYYAAVAGCENAFTVDASRITFGRGASREAGPRAKALGMTRVALFTDPRVGALPELAAVRASLASSGLDVVLFTEVRIEPSDASFEAAARFAREAKVDGYVSVGGGSVIDTCKAANLYATHPADFLAYVNAPVGEGRPVPGRLAPHIACPTTSGTGSEVTGIAIFDLVAQRLKTGIASPLLRPTEALVDPDFTRWLPSPVVAASGMDVLCHALESYTARRYVTRPAVASPLARPMSQGANPWSDIGCLEALRLLGTHFARAVADATDDEARSQVMWAATLAGIAFGNAGVHAPHGMAYAVAGLVKGYEPPGYPPGKPMIPHGTSVVVSAPSVFRYTASACPDRHLAAAAALGADIRGAREDHPGDAGEVLATELVRWMQTTRMPNGITGVGYDSADVGALTDRALPQQRLLANAPREMSRPVLEELFRGALRYW